jgi:hypothetical protein
MNNRANPAPVGRRILRVVVEGSNDTLGFYVHYFLDIVWFIYH